jgi:hypothetical protein
VVAVSLATATETYTYGNASWGDQLTQVGSTTYTYDEIGNLLSYKGYALTWEGRQLVKMSMNAGQFENTYTYN